MENGAQEWEDFNALGDWGGSYVPQELFSPRALELPVSLALFPSIVLSSSLGWHVVMGMAEKNSRTGGEVSFPTFPLGYVCDFNDAQS